MTFTRNDEHTGMLVIGKGSGVDAVTGNNSIIIGKNSCSGGYDNCLVIGDDLKATANNQVLILDLFNHVKSDDSIKKGLALIKEGISAVLLKDYSIDIEKKPFMKLSIRGDEILRTYLLKHEKDIYASYTLSDESDLIDEYDELYDLFIEVFKRRPYPVSNTEDNQMDRAELLEHLLANGVDFTEGDVVLPYGWKWLPNIEKISRIVSVTDDESADIYADDLLKLAKHKLMNNGVLDK